MMHRMRKPWKKALDVFVSSSKYVAFPELKTLLPVSKSRWIPSTHHLLKKNFSSLPQIGQPSVHSHPHLLKVNELTPGISVDEYHNRRNQVMNKLPPNSALLVFSSPERYMNHDIPYPYRQDTEFLYLTGFQEPGSTCLLTTDSEKNVTFHLFVRRRDPSSEQWDGPRAGVDNAIKLFGADKAYEADTLGNHLLPILGTTKNFFLSPPIENKLPNDFLQNIKEIAKYFKKANTVLEDVRLIKSDHELRIMRQAGIFASKAFVTAMEATVPGILESEIAALVEYQCKSQGAARLAFPCVVAAGSNATIIHYIQNTQKTKENDLLLVDAGCELDGYVSDITRTWPVSGKFSPPQKEIYEIVLNCQLECIALAKQWPTRDISLNDLHWHAVKCLTQGLVQIGILKGSTLENAIKNNLYFRYFPTHVGHYLGMDTHDTPSVSRSLPLQPGMVITIEPGLYIPMNDTCSQDYWGIGVRIEDDIVITKDGIEVLTEQVPKSISDIESLVGRKYSSSSNAR